VLEGHTGEVKSVCYSPDGGHAVSGGDEKTLRIWNTCTGALENVCKAVEVLSRARALSGARFMMKKRVGQSE
jgi:WD40 repeat protein